MTRARRTHDALAARLSADAERLGVEPPDDLAPRVVSALREAPVARPRRAPRLLPTLVVGGTLAATLLVALGPWTRPVAGSRSEITSPAAPPSQAELFAVLTPPGLDDVLPFPPVAFDLPGRMTRLAENAGRRAGAMVDGLAWPLRKLGASSGPR